jgi:2-oxoglutarate dehydrogenase E2 component (dihydrolipoamide succinyltransferase)
MATDIKVPAVGESITEGTISRWLKRDGDSVRAEEPVFELETEKATIEVPAPESGIVRITVKEGQTVPIGSVVGRIELGETAPAKRESRDQPVSVAPEKGDGVHKQQRPAAAEKREPVPSARMAPAAAQEQQKPPLSPAARRLIEEEGLDAGQIAGTGPGGRITKEDILHHLEERRRLSRPEAEKRPDRETPPPPPVPPTTPPVAPERRPAAGVEGGETRQRLSSIRQRIAERLVAAQKTAAILTTFNEADLSAVLALRARYKEEFQKKHEVGLGFMSFFVKAAVEALRAYPVVNAWIEENEVVYHSYHHIGVAVSTERGLMVPVIRDADQLSFAQIEKRIAELVDKARAGKIAVDDLQGGTFTITNGGIFGSLLSTPILNPPQSAILGMHAIQKRPVAVDDQVVIRPMMYLALSYDHRLIDGRDAVLFLVRIKECIENPERMMLQI